MISPEITTEYPNQSTAAVFGVVIFNILQKSLPQARQLLISLDVQCLFSAIISLFYLAD